MNGGWESEEQTCMLAILDVDGDCLSNNKGESIYGKPWGSTRHMHISLQTSQFMYWLHMVHNACNNIWYMLVFTGLSI
jgi:hypothetical protein